MVDRGALEKRCGRKVTVGSNPTLSAKNAGWRFLVLSRSQAAFFPNDVHHHFPVPGMNHARFFVIGGAYDTAKTDG